MKQLLIFSLIAFMFVATAGVASADTTTEHSRATITRSGGTTDSSDRTRTGSPRDNEGTPNPDGNGTVLNVTYNSEDGKLEVEFETTGDSSLANISVVINGQVFTGGQNQGDNNTSEDGVDGADGADGNNGDQGEGDDTSDEDSTEEEDRYERPARPADRTIERAR